MREPESVGDILARSGLGSPQKRRLKLSLVRTEWKRIAGERLADHSEPTKLARGVLTVSAEGPSWASEVSMASATILAGIRCLLGEGAVSSVRARSGAPPALHAAPEPEVEGAGTPLCGPAEIEGLELIKDGELREAVARAVRASRASEQSRQEGD